LIDNAIMFNPKGGKLIIETWRHDDRILIKTEDRGPGISKEEIVRIWERFYQVDKSRSPKTGGTGLGLSIVKKIIEEHGQEIRVNSEIGEGTAFIFSLSAVAEG